MCLSTTILSTDQSNHSPGFLNFQLTNYHLTLWLQHKLLKCQSPTTVLLSTPITHMIFLNQGATVTVILLLIALFIHFFTETVIH